MLDTMMLWYHVFQTLIKRLQQLSKQTPDVPRRRTRCKEKTVRTSATTTVATKAAAERTALVSNAASSKSNR